MSGVYSQRPALGAASSAWLQPREWNHHCGGVLWGHRSGLSMAPLAVGYSLLIQCLLDVSPTIKKLQQPRGCSELLECRQIWFGWTEPSPLNLGFLFCSKLSVLGKRPVLEGEMLQQLGMLGVLRFLCCLYASPKTRALCHLVFYLTTLPLTPAPWLSRSQSCRSSNVGALLGWPWWAFSSPSFPEGAGSLTLTPTLTLKIIWRFSAWHLLKAIYSFQKQRN